MNAVTITFGPRVNVHGCFYHLMQNTWRKIQSLGLIQWYREQDVVKLFCGLLDGLAYLRQNTPEDLEQQIDYFDNLQLPALPDDSVPAMRMHRLAPTFPPPIWNVNVFTPNGGSPTNKICEGWNNSFTNLVGPAHPTGLAHSWENRF